MTIEELYNLIPEKLKPYVAFALLIFYLITKYRSFLKSGVIEQQQSAAQAQGQPSPVDAQRGLAEAAVKRPNPLMEIIF
jgi:hypothetical protein